MLVARDCGVGTKLPAASRGSTTSSTRAGAGIAASVALDVDATSAAATAPVAAPAPTTVKRAVVPVPLCSGAS